MDGLRRPSNTDLVALGLVMLQRAKLPRPASVKAVLEMWPSDVALAMLHYLQRPMQYAGFSLGMASAVTGLHEAVNVSAMLSRAEQDALRGISYTERKNMNICLEEPKDDGLAYAEFCRRWEVGKVEIGACFPVA